MSNADPTQRLGYLLKHAREQLTVLTSRALAPYGIDGRELTVLMTLAAGEPASQQEAARRLGVDRTTMVALLDVLETKGLVVRRPDAADRRRNIVELTERGEQALRDGLEASAEAEREFLFPLSPSAEKALRSALRDLVLRR